MITLFGTCRIDGVHYNNNINNQVNYPHSTKEIIQQIHFLSGALTIPHPYSILCFRSGILQKTDIVLTTELQDAFKTSKLFVVEICSMKKYMSDGFYLHHLAVDKRFASYNYNYNNNNNDDYGCSTNSTNSITFECKTQTAQEIEDDILQIIKLIANRKLIVVTHYNSKRNDEFMDARNNLIVLLSDICNKYSIPIIKPSEVLKEFSQDQVMNDDLGHYTPLGFQKFSEYINNYIVNYVA